MKKRKYNKTGKYAKKQSEAVESTAEPLKEESSVSIGGGIPEGMVFPESVTTTNIKGNDYKVFTFDDLPLSVRTQVERDILYRKRLNLFDDSKERKERAVKYFLGDEPR
jgi:hypothetical protein